MGNGIGFEFSGENGEATHVVGRHVFLDGDKAEREAGEAIRQVIADNRCLVPMTREMHPRRVRRLEQIPIN